ncbi:TK/FER protein kinase [Loa loa]|uniref:Tyrosine-protein kinase n=1 Tax=Loa loa TaxID=7209 RepID=A0A1S0UB05_LOALO|nr:TK/FER protein kinase [Loa loa]EFO27598.2 TK/FER protein kinase [Loa loa]
MPIKRVSQMQNLKMSKAGGIYDHVDMDCWHGMIPDEDTAMLLKNSGDFLMRAVEHDRGYKITLSIRWGNQVVNCEIVPGVQGGYEFQGKHFCQAKDLIDSYQVTKRFLTANDTVVTLETPIRRQRWELQHKMIRLGKKIGNGSFGTVYKGTLTIGIEKSITVAVKELTEMTAEASNALWREARVMRMYDHPNVVKYYGVANDYTEREKVAAKARAKILQEAAIGLEYLHRQKCLHRDIACRNLLIGENVKVADFGMTRHTKIYKIDPNKPLNLRWLAPEAYDKGIVNKATDVYAYGVTMYECYTVPYCIPYKEWDADEVYDKVVIGGYRLQPPEMMPQVLGDLMKECIGPEKNRPTFKEIVVVLMSYLDDKL